MAQSWLFPILSGDTVSSALLSKVNDAAEALRTLHSGGTAPSDTAARMLWVQTTGDKQVYQRNDADSAWNEILAANVKNHEIVMPVVIGGLSANRNLFIGCPFQAFYAHSLVVLSNTATTSSVHATTEWAFDVYNHAQGNRLFSSYCGTGGNNPASPGELVADTAWVAEFNGNQDIVADDPLELQITKVGSPANLLEVSVFLRGWLKGA